MKTSQPSSLTQNQNLTNVSQNEFMPNTNVNAPYGFDKYDINILFRKKPLYSCTTINLQQGGLVLCEDIEVLILQLRFVEFVNQKCGFINQVFKNLQESLNYIPKGASTNFNDLVLEKYGIYSDIEKNILSLYYLKRDYCPLDYNSFEQITPINQALIKLKIVSTLIDLVSSLHVKKDKVMGFFHPSLIVYSKEKGFKIMDYSFNDIIKEMKYNSDILQLFFGFLDQQSTLTHYSETAKPNENEKNPKQRDIVLLILFVGYLFASETDNEDDLRRIKIPYEKIVTFLQRDLIASKLVKTKENFSNFLHVIKDKSIKDFLENQLKKCMEAKGNGNIEDFKLGIDDMIKKLIGSNTGICKVCQKVEIFLHRRGAWFFGSKFASLTPKWSQELGSQELGSPVSSKKNEKTQNFKDHNISNMEEKEDLMELSYEKENTIIHELDVLQLQKNKVKECYNDFLSTNLKISYTILDLVCRDCQYNDKDKIKEGEKEQKVENFYILKQKMNLLSSIANLTPDLKRKDFNEIFKNNKFLNISKKQRDMERLIYMYQEKMNLVAEKVESLHREEFLPSFISKLETMSKYKDSVNRSFKEKFKMLEKIFNDIVEKKNDLNLNNSLMTQFSKLNQLAEKYLEICKENISTFDKVVDQQISLIHNVTSKFTQKSDQVDKDYIFNSDSVKLLQEYLKPCNDYIGAVDYKLKTVKILHCPKYKEKVSSADLKVLHIVDLSKMTKLRKAVDENYTVINRNCKWVNMKNGIFITGGVRQQGDKEATPQNSAFYIEYEQIFKDEKEKENVLDFLIEEEKLNNELKKISIKEEIKEVKSNVRIARHMKEMLSNRDSHAMICVDNYGLICAGGRYTEKCEKYDFFNDKWTILSSLNSKRYFGTLFLYNGIYLYYIFGYVNNRAFNENMSDEDNEPGGIDKLDLSDLSYLEDRQSKWTKIEIKDCGERYDSKLSIVLSAILPWKNNEILIVGGKKPTGENSDRYIFNFDDETLKLLKDKGKVKDKEKDNDKEKVKDKDKEKDKDKKKDVEKDREIASKTAYLFNESVFVKINIMEYALFSSENYLIRLTNKQ